MDTSSRAHLLLQGIPTMFLMTDNQIVKEQFLVYINDLLSTGVVSDLFTQVGCVCSRATRVGLHLAEVCWSDQHPEMCDK